MTLRVLIVGATGMLGRTLLSELTHAPGLDVLGSTRCSAALLRDQVPDSLVSQIVPDVDVREPGSLEALLDTCHPDAVVNCVGVIKQHPQVGDVVNTITVNSLFPHRLAAACVERAARLIHVSTDCVFSGARGQRTEADNPDPVDLYGRSKLLGEVGRAPALTLRTSVIGHEQNSNRSLVDWFLSRTGAVPGYTGAIYSGVTAIEFAALLRSVVLPRPELSGLYHIASAAISKYDLLRLIGDAYGFGGRIIPSTEVRCDRSLSADAFFEATGYRPPPWPEMICEMHASHAPRRLSEGATNASRR
jgi:dTDP-4-dehydrorhamnose reductase